MDTTKLYLSKLIKEFRQRNALSLDGMAELSGVSRSLIYQIERQQSSPTIVVLQKLAKAMGMGLQEVLAPLDHQKTVVKGSIKEVASQASKDGSFLSYPLHSLLETSDTEIFRFQFLKKGEHQAVRSHGVRVIVFLETGELTLRESGESFKLKAGDIAELYPNRFYSYRQEKSKMAKGISVIVRI